MSKAPETLMVVSWFNVTYTTTKRVLSDQKKEGKGIDRISLKSGEKKTVKIKLGDDKFPFWNDAEEKWTVDPGKFEIR